MSLLDVFFPKLCVGCGFWGVTVCPRCERKLKRFDNTKCFYCAKSAPFGLTHEFCRKKNGIDGFLSFYYYNNFLRKVIKNIKYRLATETWRSFRGVIKPEVLYPLLFYKRLKKEFFIQPIPLHREKLRERGFNQARLIADHLAYFVHGEIVDVLEREKKTLAQAEIKSVSRRYRNVRGVFHVSGEKAVDGRRFIIVDDVVTTGMTMREAAKTLKRKGALEVFAFSLAKG